MIKNRVGLYFGSFNPIHNGHTMLANYMVEYAGLDSLWFVISPHNPFKDKTSLLEDRHRLYMVELATKGDERFEICDIEFYMPQPSYTIDTLVRLSERYPNNEFYLICGMDNLQNFHKWKNYRMILENYNLLIYPRKGYENNKLIRHKAVTVINAPEIEVSSSFIRNAVAQKKDIRYFMNPLVYKYIIDMHFYEDLSQNI